MTEASVFLAVGLPLTWAAGQEEALASYLSRNEEVSFTYRKVDYHIRIAGVRVYPQGYAAIAPFAAKLRGLSLIADIGNGAMRLYITGGGGCLVKHFYSFNAERVKLVDDICAAAKGYEYLAELQIKAGKA